MAAVLFVDDDSDLLDALEFLFSTGPHTMVKCHSVDEVRDYLEKVQAGSIAKPDLVVLDGKLKYRGEAAEVYNLVVERGLPVYRLTSEPDSIPEDQRGLGVVDKLATKEGGIVPIVENHFEKK